MLRFTNVYKCYFSGQNEGNVQNGWIFFSSWSFFWSRFLDADISQKYQRFDFARIALNGRTPREVDNRYRVWSLFLALWSSQIRSSLLCWASPTCRFLQRLWLTFFSTLTDQNLSFWTNKRIIRKLICFLLQERNLEEYVHWRPHILWAEVLYS